MTDKIEELIRQFNPQPIRIPINKCDLEEVIETLISQMFPICDCPEPVDVHEKLRKAALTLHSNISSLTGKQKAEEITESFFRLFPSLRNGSIKMRPAI